MVANLHCPDCPDHSKGKVNMFGDGVVQALQSGGCRHAGYWLGQHTGDNDLCRELSERKIYFGLHWGCLLCCSAPASTRCFSVRYPPWLAWSNAHMPSLRTTDPGPWYRNPRMQRDARWTDCHSVPWTVQSNRADSEIVSPKISFLEKLQAAAVGSQAGLGLRQLVVCGACHAWSGVEGPGQVNLASFCSVPGLQCWAGCLLHTSS